MIFKEINLNEFKEKEYKSAGLLDNDILLLESNEPDKRTVGWKEWRDVINTLRLKYNEIMKMKIYKKI